MKIIDLLNKIANREEVPNKIHIKKFQCDFIFNGYTYLSDEKEQQNIYWCLYSEALNYEIEIIEEPKKIEKITVREKTLGFPDGEWTARNMDKAFAIKINEIIDEINNLKEK